jgi:protein-S-isoprenylcysteine O-methyltransferase Ste14
MGFFLAGLVLELIRPTGWGTLWLRALAGGVVAAAGAGLIAGGLREFERAGTPVEPYRPAKMLVTGGLYRFSRNPIYLGMSLAYAGGAVILNSLWVLLLLIPAVGITRYGVIAREERYLDEKFGEPYRRYRAAVRRWV